MSVLGQQEMLNHDGSISLSVDGFCPLTIFLIKFDSIATVGFRKVSLDFQQKLSQLLDY